MTKCVKAFTLILFAAALTFPVWISRFANKCFCSTCRDGDGDTESAEHKTPRPSPYAHEELGAGTDRNPRRVSSGSQHRFRSLRTN